MLSFCRRVIKATEAQLEELQQLALQERSELESALAAATASIQTLLQSGQKDEAMAALQNAEALKAQLSALDSPAAAATVVSSTSAALAPTVSKRNTKKQLTPKQNKDYDTFASLLQQQADKALQRARALKEDGQFEAAQQAQNDYETDKLSLQRLEGYRADCVTKLPRHKENRR